jgi:predicted nucleic acid-binding Zn ribbon protein
VVALRELQKLDAVLRRCLDSVAGTGAAEIWRTWDDAVGAQIARRAQPIRLRGRTLVVAVSSAPWMQELQLLKPTLRAAINARLTRPLIGDLFFVLAEGASAAAAESRRTPVRMTERCAAPPSSADLADLPEALQRGFSDLLAAWRRRAR